MFFKQRTLLERIEYTLLDRGLNLSYKSLSGSINKDIPFEEVGSKVSIQSSRKVGWLIAGCVFFFLGGIVWLSSLSDETIDMASYLFWFIPSFICILIFFINKKNRLFLSGKTGLMFFYKKRNTQNIQDFINTVIQKRNEYLKGKYASIDLDFPRENQLMNLKLLLDESFITQDEYDDLKNKLLNHNETYKAKIGFY